MSYEQGFMDKCAQYGVNPQELIKWAQAAQPEGNGDKDITDIASGTGLARPIANSLKTVGQSKNTKGSYTTGTGVAGKVAPVKSPKVTDIRSGAGISGMATPPTDTENTLSPASGVGLAGLLSNIFGRK